MSSEVGPNRRAHRRYPPLRGDLVGFARALRRERRRRELSQEALAHQSGVHANHISEIERALKDPRLTTVLKLARALEVPLGDLVGEPGNRD
jgi:transcriptional regulator with XRE-family HTH domain